MEGRRGGGGGFRVYHGVSQHSRPFFSLCTNKGFSEVYMRQVKLLWLS